MGMTAAQFKQVIAKKTKTEKVSQTKTLPCESKAVELFYDELHEFCKAFPKLTTALNTKNKLFNSHKKYYHAEDLLHIFTFYYLDLYYPSVFKHHSKNEGKRGRVEQSKVLLMGTQSGVVDCYLRAENRVTLWIELKIKPNKPSLNQLKFLAKMDKMGDATAVCYSLFEVHHVVKKWYNDIE